MGFFRSKSKPAHFRRKRIDFHGQEFTLVELTVEEFESFRAYAAIDGSSESLAAAKLCSDGIEEFLKQSPDKIMQRISLALMQYLANEVIEFNANHDTAVEEAEKN